MKTKKWFGNCQILKRWCIRSIFEKKSHRKMLPPNTVESNETGTCKEQLSTSKNNKQKLGTMIKHKAFQELG